MPHPKNKTAQRGLVAAAATALVVGSSFMPAAAAPEVSNTPAPSASASATDASIDATGLDEALERDLNKTREQWNEDSKTVDEATKVAESLKDKGIEATATAKDGKAEITVSSKDAKAAKKAVKASAAPAAIQVTEINGSVKTVKSVYTELLTNIKPSEFKRITAIINTLDENEKPVIKVLAKNFDEDKAEKKAAKTAGASSEKVTVEEFVATAKHVKGEAAGGASKTAADTDVFGALGYITDPGTQLSQNSSICSLGFNAWAPDGSNAIISAGHCTKDGTENILGLGEQNAPGESPELGAPLGSFGFSQFGGKNNAGISQADLPTATDDDLLAVAGTDVSIIKDINPELTLFPAVSKWAADKAPRDEALNITGETKAAVGAEVCSVGRTTGWGCSEVIGEGYFGVGGFKDDVRFVWGYIAENAGQKIMDQGDSGGAVIAGTKAVGINSATNAGDDGQENTADDMAMYTSLDDAHKYMDAKYAVKRFIEAPKVMAPEGFEVNAGSSIGGVVEDAPAGTTVTIIQTDANGQPMDVPSQEVKVNANGQFNFDAPEQTGPYYFIMKAHNGFDSSANGNGNAVVVAAPTEEPTQTPTEEPTESATPTEKPTESATPTEKPTESATPTEKPTESATPTEKPTESATPTEKPTESATPTEKPTESATPTEQPSESAKPSESKDPSEKPSESKDSTEAPSKSDDSNNKDDSKKEQPKQEAPKKDDPLADTGANTVPMIAAGAALALTGAAFLLFRRSARRHG